METGTFCIHCENLKHTRCLKSFCGIDPSGNNSCKILCLVPLVDIYGKTGSFDHKCHVRKDITVPFCFNTVGCLPWLQRESGIMLQLNVVYSVGKTWYTEQNKFYAPKYISVIVGVTLRRTSQISYYEFQISMKKYTKKIIISPTNFLSDHSRTEHFVGPKHLLFFKN